MPANRFRGRLAPASANGRIGDARDEWLKEPARMADAEAVDESWQTHHFTIWNCAGFRLKRILISRTMESGSRYRNGRREQRWLSVLATACGGLAVALRALLLEVGVFHGRRCDRVRKSGFTRRFSARLRARARWHGAVRAGISPLRIAGNGTGCLS